MRKIDAKRLSSAIEARTENDLSLCNIGGASVLVAQGGEVLYRKVFGFADLAGRELDGKTLFRLASMTKPITAVATLILAERGLLSLSDTVDKFYPAFRNLSLYEKGEIIDISGKITIENILTHTSGIGSGAAWTYVNRLSTPERVATVDKYTDFLSHQPLSYIPGTKQEYSGIASFSILTGIIQSVSGMDYLDLLKKEIFLPCEMTDTTFLPSEEQWQRLCQMHNRVMGENAVGRTFDGCVFENIPAQNYLGGAGLVSSVSDYFSFARMLMGGGVLNNRRILSEKSVKLMSSPHYPSEAGEHWGLGVRVVSGDKKAPLPIGSYGWSGAYGTHFWIDPENEIIAIYMKNSRFDGGSHAKTGRNFEIDVYSALE
ncbi:MAG: beta-lactamase family protein [Clostridia bacterium]|nr:beta-lactamase family protein [Clostridia bacterium]